MANTFKVVSTKAAEPASSGTAVCSLHRRK